MVFCSLLTPTHSPNVECTSSEHGTLTTYSPPVPRGSPGLVLILALSPHGVLCLLAGTFLKRSP